MAKHGHYRGPKNASKQGIYVCAPSGKLLASINSSSPEYVLRTMQEGLKNWEKLTPEQRRLTDDSQIKPKHRWEDSFQADGLDLTVFVRDLPLSCDPAKPASIKWNQDRLWFSKTEARQWLPQVLKAGTQYELPEKIVQRIVRFNLLDTVKGQTTGFSEKEIERAKIEVTLKTVDGSKATIEFSGSSRTESRYEWDKRHPYPHGIATTLMGSAVYDITSEKFVEFEMVALGKRWGKTTFNDRNRDGPSNPIGYVFRLTSPEAPVIAPTNLKSYKANWVGQPE